MSLEDYSLMREVIAAIRKGLPEADQLQPGAVFQHVNRWGHRDATMVLPAYRHGLRASGSGSHSARQIIGMMIAQVQLVAEKVEEVEQFIRIQNAVAAVEQALSHERAAPHRA